MRLLLKVLGYRGRSRSETRGACSHVRLFWTLKESYGAQLEPENSRPGANGRAKAHALPRDPVGVTAKRAGTKELGALVQAFQDFLQGRH